MVQRTGIRKLGKRFTLRSQSIRELEESKDSRRLMNLDDWVTREERERKISVTRWSAAEESPAPLGVEDVHWYGTGEETDTSDYSRSLAFRLHGASRKILIFI